MTSSRLVPRSLAIALSAAALGWTTMLLITGLQPPGRGSVLLTGAVHAAGSLVCHQLPARSFHLHGRKFPVCARCTGLYVSGALGVLLGWLGRARAPRRTRLLILGAAVPTVSTLLVEWLGLGPVTNMARALAAVPFGVSAGWLFVRMLRAESAPSTCAMIA